MPGVTHANNISDWFKRSENSYNKRKYISIYPEQYKICTLPRLSHGEGLWKFKNANPQIIREGFVAIIPEGRVYGQGYVISPDNLLMEDVSRIVYKNEHLFSSSNHPVLQEEHFLHPKIINATIAVLATHSGRGFYHWMFDVLPRLHLLQMAGLDLNKIDYFYTNECIASYHYDSLLRIGIPHSKIISCSASTHIQARELIVPSHAGSVSAVPDWVCAFVREKFLHLPQIETSKRFLRKIYVTRLKNTHRKVLEEKHLIEELIRRGFSIIDPEDYDMKTQAEIFSQAELVVGPHGSGLANIVFCHPGTRVVEIFYPRAVSLMYWSIANSLNLNYEAYFSRGDFPLPGEDPHDNATNIEFDIDGLISFLGL
jgi:capsular polysaccharide biosynthesis protein